MWNLLTMKPDFVESKGKRGKTHCNGRKSDIEQIGPVKDSRWVRECQDYSWQHKYCLHKELVWSLNWGFNYEGEVHDVFIGRYLIINLFLFIFVCLFIPCIVVSLTPRQKTMKVEVPQESVELCNDRYGEICDAGPSTLSPKVNCDPYDEGDGSGVERPIWTALTTPATCHSLGWENLSSFS